MQVVNNPCSDLQARESMGSNVEDLCILKAPKL
jgi:hypothetical protein